MEVLNNKAPWLMHLVACIVSRKNVYHGALRCIVIEAIPFVRTRDIVATVIVQNTRDALQMPDKIGLVFYAMPTEHSCEFPINHMESPSGRHVVDLRNT